VEERVEERWEVEEGEEGGVDDFRFSLIFVFDSTSLWFCPVAYRGYLLRLGCWASSCLLLGLERKERASERKTEGTIEELLSANTHEPPSPPLFSMSEQNLADASSAPHLTERIKLLEAQLASAERERDELASEKESFACVAIASLRALRRQRGISLLPEGIWLEDVDKKTMELVERESEKEDVCRREGTIWVMEEGELDVPSLLPPPFFLERSRSETDLIRAPSHPSACSSRAQPKKNGPYLHHRSQGQETPSPTLRPSSLLSNLPVRSPGDHRDLLRHTHPQESRIGKLPTPRSRWSSHYDGGRASNLLEARSPFPTEGTSRFFPRLDQTPLPDRF